MDGSVFTIFFNKVRRKAAQFSTKKLLDANVPNFGAVLNGLNLAVSGYYYAQYYDKTYKDYYIDPAAPDGTGKAPPHEPGTPPCHHDVGGSGHGRCPDLAALVAR
jgi:hypothetical protein